jgi:hypothetical protein
MRVGNRYKSQIYYRELRRRFNWLADRGFQEMQKSEAITYFMLLRDSKPDGTSRAALTDLAKRTGMSRSTIIRAIRSLIEHDDVRIVRRGVPGKATLYSIFPSEVLKILNPQAEEWTSTATDRVSNDTYQQ